MKTRTLNKKFIQSSQSEFSMAIEYIKRNILAAAELRFSFIMQVVGMMINNCSFLIIWIFFFKAFGKINGWNTLEVVALQGFVAIVYGLSFTFCTGVLQLPNVIQNGSFDSVLLTPRNLYLRILTLATQASSVGDMIYGFIVLGFYVVLAHMSFLQVLLLLSLILPAASMLVNFALVTSCIGFFVPDAEDLAKNAFELMFGPSMYPSGMYQGATRFIFLLVVPAIAIGGLPVEAIQSISFVKILVVWILAIVWTLIALFVLKQSVKKYESGNLTGARI